MNRYLLKKTLKNLLICFFACWVVYFILEPPKEYVALAAVRLTINGAEEIYMDGELLSGHKGEVKKWIASFKNVCDYEVGPLGRYHLPHKLEWETGLGRAYAGQFDTSAIFGYRIEIGKLRLGFIGSADCDNFPLWKEEMYLE